MAAQQRRLLERCERADRAEARLLLEEGALSEEGEGLEDGEHLRMHAHSEVGRMHIARRGYMIVLGQWLRFIFGWAHLLLVGIIGLWQREVR